MDVKKSTPSRQYDPFLLKLIYSKAFFLNRLLTIHLTWSLSGSDRLTSNETEKRLNDIKLTQFLIEQEYYVTSVLDDIQHLDNTLVKHKYKFDLYYANFEFSLFRLWLFSVTSLESVKGETIRNTTYYTNLSREFDDTQFQCEIHLCAHLSNEPEMRPLFHSLLERYIEDFYFNPGGYDKKRVKSRMKQFLNVKQAVERAFYKRYYQQSQSSYTQDASKVELFQHSKESIMSIMIMYFINEFIHYLRHDTRQSWLNDNIAMTKGTTYNPKEGIATNVKKEECIGGGGGGAGNGGDDGETLKTSFMNSLLELQDKLFNILLDNLHGNIEIGPTQNESSSSSSSSSSIDPLSASTPKKKPKTSIYYSKITIHGDDGDDNNGKLYEVFDQESFYFTCNIESMPKNVSSLITDHKTMRELNTFFTGNNAEVLPSNKDAIVLIPLKDRSSYETILRIFFFDIKMDECHQCRHHNTTPQRLQVNSISSMKTVTESKGGGEERPSSVNGMIEEIFGCFICRYQYERTILRSFYNSMNKLNYHKKITSKLTLTNRSQLSICLSSINIDEIEVNEGYIYKILYTIYLILYHTPIVASKEMQRLLIPISLSSNKIHIPSHVNIFTFIDIKEVILFINRLNESQIILSGVISSLLSSCFEKSDDKTTELQLERVTGTMIRVALEVQLTLSLIAAISNQQTNIEKYERSKYLYLPQPPSPSSITTATVHDEITQCLLTIYSYYVYTLTNMVKMNK
jgi:hypothetical protein